jgi:hypothetical protein
VVGSHSPANSQPVTKQKQRRMIGYSDDGVKDASSGVYFMSYGNSIVNGKRKLHTGEERLHRK